MPLSRRRSNYELAHSIEVLLRRLTSSGMTKDQHLAEDLIRDLHERLCPKAPPKYSDTPNSLPADPHSVKVGSPRNPIRRRR